VVADYETGELHPKDLKLALSASLNKILEVMFIRNIILIYINSKLNFNNLDGKYNLNICGFLKNNQSQ
jgi:hypothetical protein